MPRRPHRIYVFGDAHFSYASTCNKCHSDPLCSTIVEFIDEVAASVRAGDTPSLDVHIEFPLYKGPTRDAQIRTFDAHVRRDASSTRRRKAMAAEQAEDASSPPQIVGIIGLLYQEYGARAYSRAGDSMQEENVRFHADDARHEDNVRIVFDRRLRSAEWVVAFHRHLRTSTQVIRVLKTFFYSKDFTGDMARLLPDGAFQPTLEALSRVPGTDRYMHKIAKQFNRLPTPALQASVRAYVDRRLEELDRLLHHDLDYEACARYLVELATVRQQRTAASSVKAAFDLPADLAPYAFSARSRRVREYLASAFDADGGVFDWPVRVLMMDVYLLCRMLRFAFQSPGGVSICYTGDIHAAFYVRFLRDQLRLVPVVCHARRLTTPAPLAATVSARTPGSLARCVPMKRGSACVLPAEATQLDDAARAIDAARSTTSRALFSLLGA